VIAYVLHGQGLAQRRADAAVVRLVLVLLMLLLMLLVARCVRRAVHLHAACCEL
jgi:hypothetical protein